MDLEEARLKTSQARACPSTWREGGSGLRTFFTFSFFIRGLGSEWDEGLRVKKERGEGGEEGIKVAFPFLGMRRRRRELMSLAAAAVESLPPSSVPSLLTLSTGGGRKRKQHPSPPLSPRGRDFPRTRASSYTDRRTDGGTDGWKGGPRCFLSHIRTGPPSAYSLFNEHRLKAPLPARGRRGAFNRCSLNRE